MQAVRYHGPGEPFRLEEVPDPSPAPGEVRVRIGAAGMCHTELHFESGLLDLGVAPVTMGHEIAGVIDRVGEGVGPGREGERVLVYYYAGCGECEWCRRREENLCEAPDAQYGFVSDGGYAEYVTVPARNALALPDGLGLAEAAPIGCGVTTAIHACSVADVGEGDVAVVHGVGTVGYGLVQVALLRGAEVIGVGRTPEKLERARSLGARATVNARETADVGGAVRELTGGRGADVVFELVGTEETMRRSRAMLARKGRLVFVGYSQDALSVHPLELVVGEKVITASVGNTRKELEEALRLVAEGEVRTFVERTVPLTDWEGAFEDLREGRAPGRIILEP